MAESIKRIPYFQKLKDPRWQKKRLEVMMERNFCCELCGDGESTLNVHHKQYLKGREPWEYNKSQLSVLCESCHSDLHSEDDLLAEVCSELPLDGPGCRDDIAALLLGIFGGSNALEERVALAKPVQFASGERIRHFVKGA